MKDFQHRQQRGAKDIVHFFLHCPFVMALWNGVLDHYSIESWDIISDFILAYTHGSNHAKFSEPSHYTSFGPFGATILHLYLNKKEW